MVLSAQQINVMCIDQKFMRPVKFQPVLIFFLTILKAYGKAIPVESLDVS
jgi:hypothetical protein